MKLYNKDCFEILPKIKKLSVDLVLVDLPYEQTSCEWDCLIDLDKMWVELKRCCKRDCVYVFFCTTKFGYKLIQSNEKWFRYDLVWEKSRKVGFLSANKMPLRKHEMIYIFSDTNNDDLDNSRNLGLRAYFKNVIEYTGKTKKELIKKIGQGIDHAFRINSSQFALPTEKTYNKLIEVYELDKMEGFRTLEDLKKEWEKIREPTYNPQKTKGKPYIVKGHNLKSNTVYGSDEVPTHENKTGDRNPTSIIKFNNPKKSLHRTQKPVDLCEYLIKTYSNAGDLVLDFTMGSGTTGEACKNTGRRFIGIEKDEEIFKIAYDRLNPKKK